MVAPHVDAKQDGASDASLRYFEKARGFHNASESILTVDSLRTHLARITLASHGLVRSLSSLLDAKEKLEEGSQTKASQTERSLETERGPSQEALEREPDVSLKDLQEDQRSSEIASSKLTSGKIIFPVKN